MKQLIPILLALSVFSTASARAGQNEIPASVPRERWSCGELDELAAKFDAVGKVPGGALLQKKELAEQFLDVMEKLPEKCWQIGRDAVPAEELEKLSTLFDLLKDDLAQYEGYQLRRDAIEKMLAKPELPPYEFKIGVNGFLRGEGVANFRLTDFGYTPGHGQGRFVYRAKPYAYWHPNDWLDIHAEGQGYGFSGSHQEFDRFSLYQGFIEATLPGDRRLALKGGRQEFSYGSSFILGGDAFYDGLTFDAARLRIRPVEPLTVDLLVGAYARPFSGGVEGNLAGARASYSFTEGNAFEAYVFRDSGSTDHHAGEYLAIWGLRGTAKVGPFSLELEPVYESGRAFNTLSGGNDRIEAYGGHADLSLESVLAGFNNKLFVSFAYGSGSRNAADGVTAAREFKTPNNDSSLVGDMNVIGDMSGVTASGHHASGLQIYTLGLGVDLSKEINLSATGRYFIANTVETGFSRQLGLETDFTLTWNIGEGLSVIAGYDRFFTGGFFRNASASDGDIDYGYLMLQFDLSGSKPKLKPRKPPSPAS